MNCVGIETIRVLDLAGYGITYPGIYTIELDVYCSDNALNPLRHLWKSGPCETPFGWNYIQVNPMIGFDNIGTAVEVGCDMHDWGCLPAYWPRKWAGGTGHKVHSGYVDGLHDLLRSLTGRSGCSPDQLGRDQGFV
jgi:hypothetical protein